MDLRAVHAGDSAPEAPRKCWLLLDFMTQVVVSPRVRISRFNPLRTVQSGNGSGAAPAEVHVTTVRHAEIIVAPRVRVGSLVDLRTPHTVNGAGAVPADPVVPVRTEVVVTPGVRIGGFVDLRAVHAIDGAGAVPRKATICTVGRCLNRWWRWCSRNDEHFVSSLVIPFVGFSDFIPRVNCCAEGNLRTNGVRDGIACLLRMTVTFLKVTVPGFLCGKLLPSLTGESDLKDRVNFLSVLDTSVFGVATVGADFRADGDSLTDTEWVIALGSALRSIRTQDVGVLGEVGGS